jgi:RecB family exonuclease
MARGLETFLAVFMLGATTAPAAADPLLHQFAVCAGRLSATMEDQWMFDGPGSERTAEELHAMVSLIEASMAPGQGREVLGWRVNAKVAQRALLHQARFAEDEAKAETAAARADALAADCRAMLLGSPGA